MEFQNEKKEQGKINIWRNNGQEISKISKRHWTTDIRRLENMK